MRVAAEQGERGGHVDRVVGSLLGDGLVDGGLEALDVEDEVGLRDVGDLRGAQLQIVRLDARRGQGGDVGVGPADLLGGVLEWVEGGDDASGRRGSRCGLALRAARYGAGRAAGQQHAAEDGAECRVKAADGFETRAVLVWGLMPRALGLMKMIVKITLAPWDQSESAEELEHGDADDGRDGDDPNGP